MTRFEREAGLLLPISALPSKYGIGCFSEEAYRFVDLLAYAGQSVWQLLPLCPTSFGDSPYQSPCSFGGNPYFISLEGLIEDGLLNYEEISRDGWGERVDYAKLYRKRFPILRLAYERFSSRQRPWDFGMFLAENCYWLEDYAIFMAIKDKYSKPLWDLPQLLRSRDADALCDFRSSHAPEIDFYRFLQYEFFKQWKALRAYAASKNIKIMGDMPIYVSADSSDVWANPELFELDREERPLYVAGCPPDGFSPTGQLWGNTVYDWQEHKNTGFRWWGDRFRQALSMYDIVRIDHFRGFDAYYSIPFGAKDATEGFWRGALGNELFSALGDLVSDERIIAEDLGFMTDGVRKLLSDCGFSGMKILQFGFDGDVEHMPYSYPERCVVYTGTHDNPTLMSWLSYLGSEEKKRLLEYLCVEGGDYKTLARRLISIAMQSRAELCVIPMQDHLYLGDEGRMNTPSSETGNWTWRMSAQDMSEQVFDRIKEITRIGGRLRISS